MIDFMLVRYLHFLGIFSVVSALVVEAILLKSVMRRSEVSLLARIDALYGIGAIVTLLAGLLMWLAVGKTAAYYTFNWIFYLKIGMFTLVGLLSIGPTVFFLKNRKGNPEDTVIIPRLMLVLVRLEVVVLAMIPAPAILMALGYGQF